MKKSASSKSRAKKSTSAKKGRRRGARFRKQVARAAKKRERKRRKSLRTAREKKRKTKGKAEGEVWRPRRRITDAELQKVRDTRAVVGAERYRQSRKFYELVKIAKEDVVGLQPLYEKLREQFDGQGGNGDTPPPTAGGGNPVTPP